MASRGARRSQSGYLSTLLGETADAPRARPPHRPAWEASVGAGPEQEASGFGAGRRRDGRPDRADGYPDGTRPVPGQARRADAASGERDAERNVGMDGPGREAARPGLRPEAANLAGPHRREDGHAVTRNGDPESGQARGSMPPAGHRATAVPHQAGRHPAGPDAAQLGEKSDPARTAEPRRQETVRPAAFVPEPASARRGPAGSTDTGTNGPDPGQRPGPASRAEPEPAPARREVTPATISALLPERAAFAHPAPDREPAQPSVHIGVVEVRIGSPVPVPAPAPAPRAPAAPAAAPAGVSRLSRPAAPFGLAQG